MPKSMKFDRQRRVPVTDNERKQIRRQKLLHPSLRNTELAQWASEKFDRPVDASIVSRSLDKKYAYLDEKDLGKDFLRVSSRSTPQWPDLEEALFEWHQ